jgi:IclR family acetate operon transcriptional repressor
MVNRRTATSSHRATTRVLDVLEHLGATEETATLASLSAQLDVPKTSLLPLLRTLVARRWVQQPQPACYRIAGNLEGKWPPARLQLPQVARPFLARLTAATRESTFLGVLPQGDDAVVYIEKVESPERIRYSADLGERRPLHCTAVGMAVFAFLPEETRNALLRKLELAPYTAHTTTDRAVLQRRLVKVAKSGIAITLAEFVKDAGAIAAPVFNRSGEIAAACVLAGPIDRMRHERDRYAATVKATASDISMALGWQPNEHPK